MKLSFITLFISLTFLFISCDNNKENEKDNNIDVSVTSSDDFEDFDLRPYELNATLLVPKYERASIDHQLDAYDWKLKVGKQIYITIQDWGTMDGFREYLEQLENQPEAIEIIEKEKDFIVYKLTTGTSKVTYHTAAQHEIEGINYLFESSEQGLSKEGVQDAVTSVKSVKMLK